MSDNYEQNEYNPSSFESRADLVIGIDFGTTFSGVAYANSGKITGSLFSLADRRNVAEKVVVVKVWPGAAASEKIPTQLSYKTTPPIWGAKVRSTEDYEPRIAHFKLGLEETVREVYRAGSDARLKRSSPKSSVLGGYLSNPDWYHPLLPEKKAVDFTADYLSAVCDYILKVRLPTAFDERFLARQQISYVITVPAIWSEKAKELTRRAAYKAGIQRRRLILITEPEAAALYCATFCDEVDLQAGDRFLICDAGGGTVDLISYKVLSLQPFRIEECSPGTGATCGSIYLNLGFENLLRKKLGKYADSILKPKILAAAHEKFDTIKRNFNPLDGDSQTESEIYLRGAPEMPHIGLEENHLPFKKDDIQSIFDPIFSQILALIEEQKEAVQTTHRAKIKTLFLVGGFGENLYLYDFLASKLKPMKVIRTESGITAIMRGAVLHKIGLDFVTDRIARRSYGVTFNAEYRPGYHPPARKVTCIDGVVRCENVMQWYAKREEKLSDGANQEYPFFRNITPAQYKEKGPLWHKTKLYACDRSVPPEYYEPLQVTPLCELTVDLRKLPSNAIAERTGSTGVYYRVHYDLGVTFGAAGTLEFKFLYEGKVRGNVEANYF